MNTYSIGIDIGGTNTDIGLVRDDGRCMTKKNLPTNKYFDASLYVADIYEQIKYLMAENHVDTIEGIGIAAPAGNYYTGCIENATNLNFKGTVDLASMFRSHLDVPVVVSNDANAAAFGELVYGGAKGMKHFVMFTLGTGVGSGIVVEASWYTARQAALVNSATPSSSPKAVLAAADAKAVWKPILPLRVSAALH